MKYEKAEDVQAMIRRLASVLFPKYNYERILAIRSYGSKASVYARIWSMPKVWQVALDIKPFYVIEVISEYFDELDEEEKEKVIIHELLHIPSTFSGALLPHKFKSKRIDDRTVNRLYEEYKRRIGERPWLIDEGY